MTVITLLNCVRDYGRRSLEGIARYANAHGGWTLALNHEEHVRQRLPAINADVRGIIAHAHHPRLLEAMTATTLPVVNLSGVSTNTGFTTVIPDNTAIGAMAAEELVGLGYRRLVALSMLRWDHSVERAATFVDAACERGASAEVLGLRSWSGIEQAVRAKLRSAPTPLAIFAGTDAMAAHAVHVCTELGLAVPEQVAVLGVDNDTLTTRMMWPTISSIDIPWEKLGFVAARRLDQMMQGEPTDTRPVLIEPTRVVTRQSTDGIGIEDPDVAAAVAFIRAQRGRPFTIGQVLDAVPVSRRSLEQRFKKCLGRTLQTHITGVRVELAKQLLTDTDYPMDDVAHRSGFKDATYFATVFKKSTGTTPTNFRGAHRIN